MESAYSKKIYSYKYRASNRRACCVCDCPLPLKGDPMCSACVEAANREGRRLLWQRYGRNFFDCDALVEYANRRSGCDEYLKERYKELRRQPYEH